MNTGYRNLYILLLLVMPFMNPTSVNAGWLDSIFGYSSYEACILDKMEGVTNNAAARSIMRACRKITDNGEGGSCSDLTTIEQRQGVTGQGRYSGNYYYVDVYNPQRNLQVSSIEVRVVGMSNGMAFEREIVLRGAPIPPLSSATLKGDLGITPSEVTAWYITAVYGCET